MNEVPLDAEAVAELIRGRLDDVSIVVASEENGAPEVAWGDMFFYAGPLGGEAAPPQRRPFATIVTQDYPAFDEDSDLDRPSAFRLNIQLRRSEFQGLFPEWSGDEPFDFTASDVLMPHPVYWRQHWVSVVNPSRERLVEMEPWLVWANERARRRGSRW